MLLLTETKPRGTLHLRLTVWYTTFLLDIVSVWRSGAKLSFSSRKAGKDSVVKCKLMLKHSYYY